MRRPVGRLAVALAPLSLVLALLPATAEAEPAATAATRPADPPVELPHAARGAAALELLGDQVDHAAALNDLRPGELADLLRTDRSAWLSEEGRVFYQEPAPAEPGTTAAVPAAVHPLADTMELHSRPGSRHTIFLDFDGATVAGTEWHEWKPATPTTHRAWDPSGNGPELTDDELTRIQAVWSAVAEDFAPFDVDVTTEDPGPDAIHRASGDDPTFGSHVLISPSSAWATLCNRVCGGIAYLAVSDLPTAPTSTGYGSLAPAWVFPQALHDDTKSIAEAASHEVGHNLGLEHDGYGSRDYYGGHGAWAPIMGVGYDRPITQWSRGSYAGATEQQDDLAMIGDVLGLRPDESGPDSSPAAPPTGTAYLSGPRDVDTYALGTCDGELRVSATPPMHANLDLSLTVLDANGAAIASADPPSAWVSRSRASGMAAALTVTVPRGDYHVAVDGVGAGSWSSGYDGYGSIGSYALDVAGGCDGSAPTTTEVQPADSTTRLSAPGRARKGSRPRVTVAVSTGDEAVSGTVTVQAGTTTERLRLRQGRATLRLPALRTGRLRVTARYRGSATTLGSSARRVIRVR